MAEVNGFKITEGNAPHIDPTQHLIETGILHRVLLSHPQTPRSVEEEVQGLAQLDVKTASMDFDSTRRKAIEALRAIARFIFKKHKIPSSNGLDIGSGATGFMVEDFLAGLIEKASWVQTDIHPDAIAENQRRHPDSTIIKGSYLDLEGSLHLRDHLDVITGLSSLDATHFIERAVGQIRTALKTGGILLHVQDVRPGIDAGFRELTKMGIETPFVAHSLVPAPQVPDVLAYQTPEGTLSVGELFRRNLARAIEATDGLELVTSSWVSATKQVGRNGSIYFLNTRTGGSHIPFETASAVVTIARKIA